MNPKVYVWSGPSPIVVVGSLNKSYIGGIWPQIGSTWLPPCPPKLWHLYKAAHGYIHDTWFAGICTCFVHCSQLAFLHWACQLVHSSCTGVQIAASHVYSNVQLCTDAIQHGRAGWEPSATNLGPDATNITYKLAAKVNKRKHWDPWREKNKSTKPCVQTPFSKSRFAEYLSH